MIPSSGIRADADQHRADHSDNRADLDLLPEKAGAPGRLQD